MYGSIHFDYSCYIQAGSARFLGHHVCCARFLSSGHSDILRCVGSCLQNTELHHINCYLFWRSNWTPIFILSHANWLTRRVRNSVKVYFHECAVLFLNTHKQRPSSFNHILPTIMLFITLTNGGKQPLGRCRRFWNGNERILGKLIVRLASVDGSASWLLACVGIRRVKLLNSANRRSVYCFVCCHKSESCIMTCQFRGSMEFMSIWKLY